MVDSDGESGGWDNAEWSNLETIVPEHFSNDGGFARVGLEENRSVRGHDG
jgi:hypothetical protein